MSIRTLLDELDAMPEHQAKTVVWQAIVDHTLAQLDLPSGQILDRIAQRHGYPNGEVMRTVIENSVKVDQVLTPTMLKALKGCAPGPDWLA